MLGKLPSARAETEGERAVSPVIGVILMVAITVILAAVIASFVLGLGDTDDPAPSIVFEGELVEDGDGDYVYEISITSGDSDADSELLQVIADEGDVDDSWYGVSGDEQEDLGAGQSIELNVGDGEQAEFEDEILLIWDDDDQLQDFEVPSDPDE